MSARRLDGTAVAAALREEIRPAVAAFAATAGRLPALHILLVGDDPASHVYVRNKERAGVDAGLNVVVHRFDASTSVDQVLARIHQLNTDDGCDGILVQSPLPAAIGKAGTTRVFDAIDPDKDVDGFHPVNVGKLVQGRAHLAPCTPSGVIALLDRSRIPIAGRHAVVIGRSEIVGKPMALLLLQRDATVTICHSRTADLASMTRQADVIVSAIGRPAFLTPSFVQPGAVVIDVGTTPVTDRQVVEMAFGTGSARLEAFDKRGSTVMGDVHPSVAEVASAMSPVPGGVGPLTIAFLLRNTLHAAQTRLQGHAGQPR